MAKSAKMVDCDDQNACTLDDCEPAKGCVHEPDKDQFCDDGNAGTEKERCEKGEKGREEGRERGENEGGGGAGKGAARGE